MILPQISTKCIYWINNLNPLPSIIMQDYYTEVKLWAIP